MRPPQDPPSQPSASAELAGVVERFEDAWQQAPPEPDLAARQALALLREGDPLCKNASEWLRQSERMLAVEVRLPAVLAGKDRPAGAAEYLDFAGLCATKKRYAAAARFYADAFAADRKLADDLEAGHRYNAACSAALAAAGQGVDAPTPDGQERARLRRQAVGWLRDDLGARAKAGDRARLRRTLAAWQQDPDLAGARGPEALAALPADERADWEKLWADVADLLRQTGVAEGGTGHPGN
jgi:hypothetical protein